MKFDGGEQAKYLTRVRVEVDGQFGRENGAGSPKRLGVTPEDSAVVAISVRAATRVCVEIARRTEASVGDSQWWAEPPPLEPISFRCRSRSRRQWSRRSSEDITWPTASRASREIPNRPKLRASGGQ